MTAEEHNKFYNFFHEITGEAMLVHREFHEGLLESAYEAALEYLLKIKAILLSGRSICQCIGKTCNLISIIAWTL